MPKKSPKAARKTPFQSPKPALRGKKPIVYLVGTATATAAVRIEVRISDAHYAVDILNEDIKNKRVWFDAPPDEQGWMNLQYSADGATGDPFPIGKIRISLDPNGLDKNFVDMRKLAFERSR